MVIYFGRTGQLVRRVDVVGTVREQRGSPALVSKILSWGVLCGRRRNYETFNYRSDTVVLYTRLPHLLHARLHVSIHCLHQRHHLPTTRLLRIDLSTAHHADCDNALGRTLVQQQLYAAKAKLLLFCQPSDWKSIQANSNGPQ
jgi:hypothetical protein